MGAFDPKGKNAERAAAHEPASVPSSQQVLPAAGPLGALGNRALLHLLRSGRLQRKPRVSEPGEPLEHQADRAAEAVVESTHLLPAPTEAPGAESLGGLGSGQPLDEDARVLMESRFGESFSGVRVHAGAQAADLASSVQARAFTVGQDIVFGEHEYAPGTTAGRRLLAHELAHTLQQRHGAGEPEPSKVDHAAEHDADRAARQVEAGGKAMVHERAAPGVQRQAKSAPEPTLEVIPLPAGSAVLVNGISVVEIESPPGGTPLRAAGSWIAETRTYRVAVQAPDDSSWDFIRSSESDLRKTISEFSIFVRSVHHHEWRRNSESPPEKWDEVKTESWGYKPHSAPKQPPKPGPPPAPKPPAPKAPQVTPPEPEPKAEPGAEARPPQPVDSSPIGRLREALARDPAKAVELIPQLSDLEMESLSLEDRLRLLEALGRYRYGGELDISSVKRLLGTTPDRDATDLYSRLLQEGGRTLDLLQQHAVGVAGLELELALRHLQRRGQYGFTPKEGFVRRFVGIDGKARYLNEVQIQKMVADAPRALERGFKDIEERALWGKQTQKSVLGEYQLDVETWGDIWNRPASLIGIFSDIWGDTHAPSSRIWDDPQRYAKVGREALAKGNLKEAALYFRLASDEIARVDLEWKIYTGQTIAGAEQLTEDIKIAATTAIVVATAGYAAPAVFGTSLTLIGGEGTVLATAGLGTKAGATLLTATTLGFWGGLEGGVVRTGLGSISGPRTADALGEEFWKGVQTGAPAGFSAGIGYGGMGTLGIGGRMPITWLNLGKAGLVHGVSGASSGALGTFLQGGSAGDIAKTSARDFGFGFLGGAAGARMQPWLGNSVWRNRAYQTFTGGLFPAAGTWLTGGSRRDIEKAFLTGAGTSFITSLAPHPGEWKPPRRSPLLLTEGSTPLITPPSRQLMPAPADRLPAILGPDVYAQYHAEAIALRAQHPELAGLSIPELIAVRAYTGPYFEPINALLRAPTPAGEKYQPLVDFAASGLEKLPGHTGPLVRREKGFLSDVLARYPPGEVHEQSAFYSTNRGDFAKNIGGMVYVSIDAPVGQGKPVSMLSLYPTENEVLYSPRARFQVVHVGEAGDAILVRLRELPRSVYAPAGATQWVIPNPTPTEGGPVLVPRPIPGLLGPSGPMQWVIPKGGGGAPGAPGGSGGPGGAGPFLLPPPDITPPSHQLPPPQLRPPEFRWVAQGFSDTFPVLSRITPLAGVREGTLVPRTFELETAGGQRYWVGGSATEHFPEILKGYREFWAATGRGTPNPEAVMYNVGSEQKPVIRGSTTATFSTEEGVADLSFNRRGPAGGSVMASAMALEHFEAAASSAARRVEADPALWGTKFIEKGWEFIFQKPKQPGQLPGITHALPVHGHPDYDLNLPGTLKIPKDKPPF